jgi:hypothetical protein
MNTYPPHLLLIFLGHHGLAETGGARSLLAAHETLSSSAHGRTLAAAKNHGLLARLRVHRLVQAMHIELLRCCRGLLDGPFRHEQRVPSCWLFDLKDRVSRTLSLGFR